MSIAHFGRTAMVAATILCLAACGNRDAGTVTGSTPQVALTGSATGPSAAVLQWTISPATPSVVSYRVTRNNKTVATVAANSFTDTGLTAGTTLIYKALALDAQSNVLATSNAATVMTFADSVGGVVVSPGTPSLLVGQTVQLTTAVTDGSGHPLNGQPTTWISNAPAIATVSSSGLVTGVSVGPVSIVATVEAKSGSAAVTVSATPVASIVVSPTSASVSVGQTAQLTATAKAADNSVLTGRTIAWSSADSTIATVTASGLVVGVRAGSVAITAASGGKSAQVAITVTAATVATVAVAPPSPSVVAGNTVAMTATARDGGGNILTGQQVTWTSGNTAVATVASNGTVSALTPGTSLITATVGGQSGSQTVTVTPAPVATITLTPNNPIVTIGATVQLTATLRDAFGNVLTGRTVTWSTSANLIASISVNGLASALTVGSATITASSGGQSATVVVTTTLVPVGSVVVTPGTLTIDIGNSPVALTATVFDTAGNVLTGRQVIWSSANSGLIGVSIGGLVSGLGVGSTTVTATVGGKSGSASINSQLTPVFRVTVAPPTVSLALGLTVQLTATAFDSSGNALSGRVAVWSVDAPTLASISASGILSAIAIGTVNVTVTIGGQHATSTITLIPPLPVIDSLFACAADSLSTTVSKTIGPLGGTIKFGPHTLVVPVAAVLVSTKITATALGDGHLSAQLEPDGLQFLVPPTLVLGYGQCSPAPQSDLQIAYLNGLLGQILQLLISVNNTVAHTVSAPITHFSVYAGSESR